MRKELKESLEIIQNEIAKISKLESLVISEIYEVKNIYNFSNKQMEVIFALDRK